MNTRLLAYLRKLGLDTNATDEQAWEFFRARRGLEANIANALNYDEADIAARTNCDLMIRALGHNPDEPSQVLTTTVPADQFRTQAGTDGASASGDLEAARAEGAQREAARRSEIRQLGAMAGTSSDLIATLENDPGITVEAARQRLFDDHQARTRASVPQESGSQGPAVHSRSSVTGITAELLEAAILHRSGIDPTQNWVRSQDNTPRRRRANGNDLANIAEEAWQYRTISMEECIRHAARIDGVSVPHARNGLLEAYLRSAPSTNTLVNIYTTNMSSQLLSAFEVAPDSTGGGWIRESDVQNFKTNERARLEQGGALVKLPRGKEADHATFEDNVETFKIARYAKQYVVDDQDIVDDTFGATNQFAPADLGVAARQLRPDLVYSILIGNPAMRDTKALFHIDHKNLKASSGGLSSWLGSARAAMRLQTEHGRALNINAAFLIVPPTLEDTADTMVHSRVLITGEAATKPANNPNFNKGLQIVVEARLENGVTDPSTGVTYAGASDHWFLSATSAFHTIEVAYLSGAGRVPQIRPFVLTQGRWGIGWDIKHDIGAKALSWEGLYRSEA